MLLVVEPRGSTLTIRPHEVDNEAAPPRVLVALAPTLPEMELALDALSVQAWVAEEAFHRRSPAFARFEGALVLTLLEARLDDMTQTAKFTRVTIAMMRQHLLLVVEADHSVTRSLPGATGVDSGELSATLTDVIVLRVLHAVVDTHAEVLAEYEYIVDELEDALWGSGTNRRSGALMWRSRRLMAEHHRALKQINAAAADFLSARDYLGTSEGLRNAQASMINDLGEFLRKSEALDIMVKDLFETFYAEQGRRISESSQRLSAGVAIIGVPTALAGLISLFPGGVDPLGYAITLAVLVAVAAVLWWEFRRRNWV